MRLLSILWGWVLLGSSPMAADLAVSVTSTEASPVQAQISWSLEDETTDGNVRNLAAEREVSGSIQVSIPWSGTLDLAPSKTWKIEVLAEELWAPSVVWSGKPSSVKIRLEPATEVSGSIKFTTPKDIPASVDLHAWIHLSDPRAKTRPKWEALECTIAQLEFHCTIPFGAFDLKFAVPDHAPVYLWGQTAEGEALNVGRIVMRQGGSVSGQVIAEARLNESPIVVRLIPRTLGVQRDPTEARRNGLRSLETEATVDGLFSLGPVPRGGYDLEVSAEGLVTHRIEDLDLTNVNEVLLEGVIELVSAPDLNLYLTPPVTPDQQPWEIALMRPSSRSNTYETMETSGAAFDGHWHRSAVPPGEYRIEVRDHRGSVWLAREIELDPLGQPFFFEMESVAVQGNLTLGGEPTEGVVVFGMRQGRPNVALTADQGAFQGILPRAGNWDLEVELEGSGGRYSVRLEPMTIVATASGEATELEISLPETSLEGDVQRNGKKIPSAFVLIRGDLDGQERFLARVRTDEEGHFSVLGLKPAEMRVSAYLGHFDPASDWVTVDLRENQETPFLTLDLIDKIKYQAQVLGEHGPVSGAQVFVENASPFAGSGWPTQAVSGSNGIVEFRLPAQSRGQPILFLTVASGYGTVIHTAQPSSDLIPIPLSSAKGDLVLAYLRGTLFFQGVPISVSRLLSKLLAVGRVAPNPEGGATFRAMAVGEYRHCPEDSQEQGCVQGILSPAGTLKLQAFEVVAEDSQ